MLGFPGLNDHSLLSLSSLSPPLFLSLSHTFSLTHILSLPLFSHTFSPPLTLSHHTGYPIPNSGIHLNVFSSFEKSECSGVHTKFSMQSMYLLSHQWLFPAHMAPAIINLSINDKVRHYILSTTNHLYCNSIRPKVTITPVSMLAL